MNFPEAIDATTSLLKQLEQNEIDDSSAEASVTALVASKDGARGFWVGYLAGNSPIADSHPACILNGLKQSDDYQQIGSLLFKNTIMSAAVAVRHAHTNAPALLAGSNQVTRRSQEIAKLLWCDHLARQWQKVNESLVAIIEARKQGLDWQTIAADPACNSEDIAKLAGREDYDLEQLEAANFALCGANAL